MPKILIKIDDDRGPFSILPIPRSERKIILNAKSKRIKTQQRCVEFCSPLLFWGPLSLYLPLIFIFCPQEEERFEPLAGVTGPQSTMAMPSLTYKDCTTHHMS